MEDFYELLDLRPKDDLETIENELKKLNKTYRQRANLKDPKIRNEATDRINLIGRAMVKFRSDEDRTIYDKELAEYKKQTQFHEPLIDVDFYVFLSLPVNAMPEQIQQRLDEMQKSIEDQPQNNEKVLREKQILEDAQATLLDLKNRQRYDEQIKTKHEFERKREYEKPTPLKVSSVEVSDWISLEDALTTNPDLGLFLLQDGEIEAWLRWSLGQKQRANWVREIANKSRTSDVPFMEFEELLRLINANRPLVLYESGESPGNGLLPLINQTNEIPGLADKNWRLFAQRLEYILDWIAQYGNSEVLDKLNKLPRSEVPDIQLERLVFAINPQIPTPGAKIEGVTDNKIDFGILSKWESAAVDIIITQTGRGFLYGTISSTAPWIQLNQNIITGPETNLHVSIDRANLASGSGNSGTIVLNLLDGRLPALQIEIIVEQRTTWQSVKNIFKKG